MRMADRARFRNSLFPTLSSRALLVLGGVAMVACSAGAPEPRAVEDVANLEEPLVSNPCNGATLVARRNYLPASWLDGEVAFTAGTLTFVVPAILPVSAGSAAHGKAKLTFSTGGGVPTVCVYRGDGRTKFVFKRCRRGAVASPDSDPFPPRATPHPPIHSCSMSTKVTGRPVRPSFR